MSRSVLAIMAGLLCMLAGFRHASALKGDAVRLARWVQLLQHLSLLLKEGTLSIPDALCAAADRQLPPDKLLRNLANRLRVQPNRSLEQLYGEQDASVLTSPVEREPLMRLLARLGHGSREQRCLAVEQAAEEFRLFAEQAAQKAEKDAKLWQTLGITGGMCLTIMLL